jgi:hypothetical protein
MDGKTTLTEQLAQVNAAIAAVLAGGQSYRLGNQSVTRADLAALKALRDDLAAQAAQEDVDELLSRTYAARFDGR